MKKIVAVVGPTSSGKSDVAVDIALRYKGEVISADSRQIYKGLDIGSGKITKEEMRGIPHYMLDVADPKERFTVKTYKEMSENVISNILKRELLPIICGGTGFYVSALVDRINFPKIPPDESFREKYQNKDTEELFKELQKKDPERARTVDPLNKHRLIRSLEIVKHMGFVPKVSKKKPLYDALFIGLDRPSKELKERIEKRLHKRLNEGMLEEASRLNKEGLSLERMDEMGLEYRFMARHLNGDISEDEMKEAIKQSSWQYVKRQRTWFKKDERIIWFHPDQEIEIYAKVGSFLEK